MNDYAARLLDAFSQDSTERHDRIVSVSGAYASDRAVENNVERENNNCDRVELGSPRNIEPSSVLSFFL